MSSDIDDDMCARLFCLWAAISKMVVDGKRDPEKVARSLQEIVDGSYDIVVHVNRSVKPTYPNDLKELEDSELKYPRRAEFNLQTGVELWLHEDQKNGAVVGNTIYKRLKKDGMLALCLNLQDGLAIQVKGIASFRKFFGGKAVFLWGSVARNRDSTLSVPYLFEWRNDVVVNWRSLDNDWGYHDPALRFRD